MEEKSTLTLALLDVGVDLVQSSHGDLSDLRVEQQLHQGGGDVFAGRHAGCLGHFTLRGRRREEEMSEVSYTFHLFLGDTHLLLLLSPEM